MSTDKIITQNDVAKKAGVSRGVVSYVINDGPREVSLETRNRVLSAIQELGYHPNKYAQSLKRGAKAARKSLGIIAGGQSFNVLERPYYNMILAGLFEEAHRLGIEVRFFSFFDALMDPVFFNKKIHPDEIPSLVMILPAMIIEKTEYAEILDQIAARVDNVVCLEEPLRGWPTVIFDRAAAARQAMEHLLKLGHKRIAFLAIPDARLAGYKQTLMEHNQPYDESLVFTPDSANILASSYEVTEKIIHIQPRPTAIFAANDEIAISAIASLRDHGLRVPLDFAVVSIDDIGISAMMRPSLTTVHVPKKEMAAYALQMILLHEQMQGQQSASIVLPTELIIRESCGGKKTD